MNTVCMALNILLERIGEPTLKIDDLATEKMARHNDIYIYA